MSEPSAVPAPSAEELAYCERLLRCGTVSADDEAPFARLFDDRSWPRLSRVQALRLLERYGGELLTPSGPPGAPERAPLRPSSERYLLGAELGRGGMGAVFSVRDRTLDRDLAMKVLLAADSERGLDPARRRRFLREARTLAQLEHPGVVPIHELGEDERGRPFFTMRRVTGDDLGRRFAAATASGDLRERARALRLLLRACETVAFAHERGIVHRDLKPSNVLIGENGEVYVTDWGLALRWRAAREEGGAASEVPAVSDDARATATGTVLGTPAYMPPEQALGLREELGPWTDVYALGAMLYQLLHGSAPYLERTRSTPAREVLEALVQGPPTFPRDAHPELVAICEKAMARRPEARYPDAGALAADLRAHLEGRVVAAHSTGPRARLGKWVGRHRALSAVIAVIVAMLAFSPLSLRVGSAWWSALHSELEKLSDLTRVRHLQERAKLLWPARPDWTEAFAEWLAEAEEVTGRLPEHRERLASLDAESGETEDPFDDWQHKRLRALVEDLEELGPIVTIVRERLELVEKGAKAQEDPTWAAAIEELAAIDGITLAPQFGLLPLGRDDYSGRWEFVHVLTGDPPTRRENGSWRLDEGTGVILVLLPGGTFRMGASEEDGEAKPDERPQREVELDPFLVSKYELTRAQWSEIAAVVLTERWRKHLTYASGRGLLPVTDLIWDEVKAPLQRIGLGLPTEARWEYAARGGTTGPWWFEEDPRPVETLEHIAPGGGEPPPTDPLEVGSLRPNPYGLFDVLGNVSEWCLDYQGSYVLPPEPGTGLRCTTTSQNVVRGGRFTRGVSEARSSYRGGAGDRGPDVGLRPARSVEH